MVQGVTYARKLLWELGCGELVSGISLAASF